MENRTNEQEMALLVMLFLGKTSKGCLNLDQLREKIEGSGILTEEDCAGSPQPKWHQILRNINCNRGTGNNFIHTGLLEHKSGGGYCLTEDGLKSLNRVGG